MSQHSKPGFRWLEVCVTIGCAAVIFGLLLPAIRSSRPPARRRPCMNNLRNWGLAVLGYENARRQLPGSQELLVLDRRDPASPSVPVTWAGAVVDYLERSDLRATAWAAMRAERGERDAYLEIAVCPAVPNARRRGQMNSYVANAGFVPRASDPRPLSEPGYLMRAVRPANGLFLHRIRHDGPSGIFDPPRGVRIGDIHDGTSQTIMLSENLQAGSWKQIGPLDYSRTAFNYYTDRDANGTTIAVPQRARFFATFVWLYAKDSAMKRGEDPHFTTQTPLAAQAAHATMRINGNIQPLPMLSGPPTIEAARPSSLHTGGVNIVFADNSATFLRDDIDYHVYQQLMTPHGARSDLPFRRLILRESDFKR